MLVGFGPLAQDLCSTRNLDDTYPERPTGFVSAIPIGLATHNVYSDNKHISLTINKRLSIHFHIYGSAIWFRFPFSWDVSRFSESLVGHLFFFSSCIATASKRLANPLHLRLGRLTFFSFLLLPWAGYLLLESREQLCSMIFGVSLFFFASKKTMMIYKREKIMMKGYTA
jgi:hypothetical protein